MQARRRLDRLRAAAWLVAVALLACHFALNLQQNGKTFLDAAAYVHLAEKRPYQYRVLMAPVLGGLIEVFAQPPAARLLAQAPVYVSTPVGAAYVAVNAVAFAAACLLMAAIARRTLGAGVPTRLALAVYVAAAYFFFCLNPNVAFVLPYDVPSLALSQACLLCVLARRRAWLYALFALATLNRESSLLVVVFIAARAAFDPAGGDDGHDGAAGAVVPRRRRAVDLVALGLLWIAIKAGLYLAFAHLPSDEGWRLDDNLHALMKPWQWPALLPLLACVAMSFASLRAAAATRPWALTGCTGFALVFLTGQILETRAFADLIPFFAIATAGWLLEKTESTQLPQRRRGRREAQRKNQ